MPESEIENCIDGYEGEFASVFESAGRSVERARAELAELRAKAERANRAGDAELIVRLVSSSAALEWECDVFTERPTWSLRNEIGETIDSGPIVGGLPRLTDTARAAIVQALERREG